MSLISYAASHYREIGLLCFACSITIAALATTYRQVLRLSQALIGLLLPAAAAYMVVQIEEESVAFNNL